MAAERPYYRLSELIALIQRKPSSVFMMGFIAIDRKRDNQGTFRINSIPELELTTVAIEVDTQLGVVPLLLKYIRSENGVAHFQVKNTAYQLQIREVGTRLTTLQRLLEDGSIKAYVSDLAEVAESLKYELFGRNVQIGYSRIGKIDPENVDEALQTQPVCYLKIQSAMSAIDQMGNRRFTTSWLGFSPLVADDNRYILYSPTEQALFSVRRDWLNQRHPQLSWWCE